MLEAVACWVGSRFEPTVAFRIAKDGEGRVRVGWGEDGA